MTESLDWEAGINGDFQLNKEVVEGIVVSSAGLNQSHLPSFAVMPPGTIVISAESHGISSWTKTAKVSVLLPDKRSKRYFLKVKSSYKTAIPYTNARTLLYSAPLERVRKPLSRVKLTQHPLSKPSYQDLCLRSQATDNTTMGEH